MRKKTRRTSKHFGLWALIIVLVLVAGSGTAYYIHDHHTKKVSSSGVVNPVNTINYGPSNPQDNTANNSRKSSSPSTTTQTLNTPPSSSSNPSSSPSNAQGITVTVTRANVSGSNLQVAAIISNASAGTCTLTVSQSGQQSITQTETVQLQTNSYVCPVFSVPLSSFPNQTQWNVSVSVTDNGSTAIGQWQDNPVAL